MNYILCPDAPDVYVQCDENCASCEYAERAALED